MLAIRKPTHKCKRLRVVVIDDDTGKSRSATVYGGTKEQAIEAFIDAIQAAADSSDVKVAPKAKGVASAA